MHLGHFVESVVIGVRSYGEIVSYSGNYDTENIIFSVKEVYEEKAREAMAKLLDNADYVLPSNYSWTISDNNKPAIEIIIKIDEGWDVYIVEINQDDKYVAYPKYRFELCNTK